MGSGRITETFGDGEWASAFLLVDGDDSNGTSIGGDGGDLSESDHIPEEKEDDSGLLADDPRAYAEMIADILYGLYGEDALADFMADSSDDGDLEEAEIPVEEAWNALHHPRGKNGRFIPKGSGEARAAASEVISKVLRGEHDEKADAESVAQHLSILTVKQIKDLHREHGQKPPRELREGLVNAVLSRLPVSEKEKEKPQETPVEDVGDSHPDVSGGGADTAVDAPDVKGDAPDTVGDAPGTVGGAAPDAVKTAPPADKPKVEYVRAPVGGATSDVDGKFYKGGQLMPVHGMYSGQEKVKGKGDGVGGSTSPADPEKEGGGKRASREPRSQLSPEDVARKERDQKLWKEVSGGPLGQIRWMGDSPNRKALEMYGSDQEKWKAFADGVGRDKIDRMVSILEPVVAGKIREKATRDAADEMFQANAIAMGGKPYDPQSDIDWQLNKIRDDANYDQSMSPRKNGAHAKGNPNSFYLRSLVHTAIEQAKESDDTVAELHALNSVLSGADYPDLAAKYGQAPTPDVAGGAPGGGDAGRVGAATGDVVGAGGDSGPQPHAEITPAQFSGSLADRMKQGKEEERQAHELGKSVASAWTQSASPAERQAVTWYRDGGYKYANKQLRDGSPVDSDRAGQLKSHGVAFDNSELISHMDSILDKGKTTSPVVTFRGLSPNQGKRLLGMHPGSEFVESGYSSTTLSPTYAYTGFGKDSGVVARVRVPEGTPSAYLSAEDGVESELLLARGAKYRVANVTKATGPDGRKYSVVNLDLVGSRDTASPADPKFTGTDSLGRKWVNGELVARQEEPGEASGGKAAGDAADDVTTAPEISSQNNPATVVDKPTGDATIAADRPEGVAGGGEGVKTMRHTAESPAPLVGTPKQIETAFSVRSTLLNELQQDIAISQRAGDTSRVKLVQGILDMAANQDSAGFWASQPRHSGFLPWKAALEAAEKNPPIKTRLEGKQLHGSEKQVAYGADMRNEALAPIHKAADNASRLVGGADAGEYEPLREFARNIAADPYNSMHWYAMADRWQELGLPANGAKSAFGIDKDPEKIRKIGRLLDQTDAKFWIDNRGKPIGALMDLASTQSVVPAESVKPSGGEVPAPAPAATSEPSAPAPATPAAPEPIKTKTSSGIEVTLTPALGYLNMPSVEATFTHPTMGDVHLKDISWSAAGKGKPATAHGRTSKGQGVHLTIPKADFDRAVSAAKGIVQQEVNDIKAGKTPMKIHYRQGSPLSGHATGNSRVADVLKELGLAEDVAGWGTRVRSEVAKELGETFTYQQAKELSDRLYAPDRQKAAERQAAETARREPIFAKAKATGERQVISRHLVGETPTGHVFETVWANPDGTTSTTEFRE